MLFHGNFEGNSKSGGVYSISSSWSRLRLNWRGPQFVRPSLFWLAKALLLGVYLSAMLLAETAECLAAVRYAPQPPKITDSGARVSIPFIPGFSAFSDSIHDGTLDGYLHLPVGKGPFSFVVMLHGSAAITEQATGIRNRIWTDLFVSRGIGVLVLNSFTTRSLPNIFDAWNKWTPVRVDDAYSALTWLQDQPYARKDHVYLVGFSNGGTVALVSMTTRSLAAHTERGALRAPFAGAVALYPDCSYRDIAEDTLYAPVEVGVGEKDDWTLASKCTNLEKQSNLHLDVYPGATHEFDIPLDDHVLLGKYHIRYNKAAADLAMESAIKMVK